MTTHDRDKVIAAAKEAGADFKCETLIVNGKDADEFITNFYAIAFEDGRQAEREECSSGWEPHKEYFGSTIVDTIRARGDTK